MKVLAAQPKLVELVQDAILGRDRVREAAARRPHHPGADRPGAGRVAPAGAGEHIEQAANFMIVRLEREREPEPA